MATTLSLLKSPVLPRTPPFIHSKLPSLPKQPRLDACKKDFNSRLNLFSETTHHLPSSSLRLTAFAFPFLLDAKAISTSNCFSLQCLSVLGLNYAYFWWVNFYWAGCTCCWWGVWDIGGKDICTHTSNCDGVLVLLHLVGWVFGLAMEASEDHTEWDQWAQEASQAYPCYTWRDTCGSSTISCWNQNPATLWGKQAATFHINQIQLWSGLKLEIVF